MLNRAGFFSRGIPGSVPTRRTLPPSITTFGTTPERGECASSHSVVLAGFPTPLSFAGLVPLSEVSASGDPMGENAPPAGGPAPVSASLKTGPGSEKFRFPSPPFPYITV